MSDFSEDLSPDKPVRNIYIGKTPIDAIYEGEKLLWPRDDSEINPQSLSELMEKRPTKQLTAEEFAALESRDAATLFMLFLGLFQRVPGRNGTGFSSSGAKSFRILHQARDR